MLWVPREWQETQTGLSTHPGHLLLGPTAQASLGPSMLDKEKRQLGGPPCPSGAFFGSQGYLSIANTCSPVLPAANPGMALL